MARTIDTLHDKPHVQSALAEYLNQQFAYGVWGHSGRGLLVFATQGAQHRTHWLAGD